MDRIFSNKKTAIVLTFFSMLLWGSAIPLIKTTYTAFGIDTSDTGAKILIAGCRFFMAGVLGFLYDFVLRKTGMYGQEETGGVLTRIWGERRYILTLAVMQTVVQYIFYYIGLSNTSGIKSSIIQASNAMLVATLSALLLKDEHFTKKRVLALILGTIGILIVNLGKGGSTSGFRLTGEGFVLMSTLTNVSCTLYVKHFGKGKNAFFTTAAQFFLGSLVLLLIGFFTCRQFPVISWKPILMLLYGGFISSTAFSLWALVLQHQSSVEFAVYKLFIPIFGTLGSVIFLGEHFTIRLVLGMVLVLGGALIVNLS